MAKYGKCPIELPSVQECDARMLTWIFYRPAQKINPTSVVLYKLFVKRLRLTKQPFLILLMLPF